LTKLREHVLSQLRQWEADADSIEERTNVTRAEVLNNARALVDEVDTLLSRWGVNPKEAARRVEQGMPGRKFLETKLSHLGQLDSALGELRVNAYKADAQAKHTCQYQATLLCSTIDAITRQWRQELIKLHIAEDKVLTEATYCGLAATKHKLRECCGTALDSRPGLAPEVEKMLSQAEQRIRQALAAIVEPQDASQDHSITAW
jgi:hypothetical protein